MLFAPYRKLKKIIGDAPKQNLEHFYLYNLNFNDIAVNLYVSKKRAAKRAHIHCTESGDIMWELPLWRYVKTFERKEICVKTRM